MKSYMDLVHDPIWNDPRPWLVAGTGPSLDGWSDDIRAKYRVMAIHKAAFLTDPDVVVAYDWNPFKAVLDRMVPRLAIVSTDIQSIYYPRFTLADTEDERFHSLYENSMYVFRTSNKPDVDPEAGPGIKIRHATGEAAVDILGHLGVKEFTTIGIDGGGSHAKAMNEPEVDGDPYGPHMDYVLDAVKRHGMTWTRIMYSNPSPSSHGI